MSGKDPGNFEKEVIVNRTVMLEIILSLQQETKLIRLKGEGKDV